MTMIDIDEPALRKALLAEADKLQAAPEHWITNWDASFSFCYECAEKEINELRKQNPNGEYILDGGWATEGDSQAFCDTCGQVLDNNFTDYACEVEIAHFKENGWTFTPLDCLSLLNIIGSYGLEDPEWRKPEDRIAADIRKLCTQAIGAAKNFI